MGDGSTVLIFGSYVLVRRDGAQEVLRDHWVVVEGDKITAVTPSRPAAADRDPGPVDLARRSHHVVAAGAVPL